MNVRNLIIHDAGDEITSLKRLLMQEGYEVVAIPLKMGQNEQVGWIKEAPLCLSQGSVRKHVLLTIGDSDVCMTNPAFINLFVKTSDISSLLPDQSYLLTDSGVYGS